MLRRILAIALLACLAQAQEFRSTLSGRVTDPSGAVVPAAKVTAIKADTNSRFETVANSDGLYTIPFLPPGPYPVTADATGFKKYVQEGNVCNRVLFGAPNLTPTATTFGVITTQSNVPRAIQAALRLTF